MGPRPTDFDEQLIRQSPTFIKWSQLGSGEKLRYACREFVKGNGDDEERLMRRIMIARRNNIRDHQTLKRARQITTTDGSAPGAVEEEAIPPPVKAIKVEPTTTVRKRRPSTLFSDTEVAKEMDVSAVEATRSFLAWKDLKEGEVFVYNQKYIKGQANHEWLLKKNIWRRMRYRRENKKMVEQLRHVHAPGDKYRVVASASSMASQIIDQTLLHPTANQVSDSPEDNTTSSSNIQPAPPLPSSVVDDDMTEAVEAAVKVAESYSQSAHYNDAMVHNALDTAANPAALDAAARLAAATSVDEEAVAAAAAAAAEPSQYQFKEEEIVTEM